ncbi:hypothetical protein Pelo_6546 [Pelomyxa schiedti]|nr:hypothetical protein Pelo_6546 [Pelomyxa schiedti]
MDSRTSVHVIKTACHVVVAVFVRPAALPDSAQSSVSPIPLKCTRLQSLASKAEFVYFVERYVVNFNIDFFFFQGDIQGQNALMSTIKFPTSPSDGIDMAQLQLMFKKFVEEHTRDFEMTQAPLQQQIIVHIIREDYYLLFTGYYFYSSYNNITDI